VKSLREWRNTRVLGVAELATRAGVSKTTVINIEHGRSREIKRRTMRRLSEALGVEAADVAEFAAALEQSDDENAPATSA